MRDNSWKWNERWESGNPRGDKLETIFGTVIHGRVVIRVGWRTQIATFKLNDGLWDDAECVNVIAMIGHIGVKAGNDVVKVNKSASLGRTGVKARAHES